MRQIMGMLMVGMAVDRLLGDPQGWYHPVRTMGTWIASGERWLRAIFPKTARGELAGGAALCAFVLILSGGIPALLLWAAGQIHPALRFLLGSAMCWQLLAAKSLRDESMKVYDALAEGDVEKARFAVSMIVGRDTKPLSREGIIRAAVETVAENTSDGVIAPLLYMALGGPVLGFLYKGINTMDSMVGYHNERYEYFGRAAARLDDAANFLPSRISALLMLGAAFLSGMDGKNGWRIFLRDRKNHKSPNSAQTEAACAGILHVQLAGDAWYFGRLVKKPLIGDDDRPVEAEDIARANRLMYGSQWLGLVLAVCLTFLYRRTLG